MRQNLTLSIGVEIQRIEVRFADWRNIYYLAAHSVYQRGVFVFGVYDIEFCIRKTKIQHQNFELYEQRFAAAGGTQHHTISVRQFGTQADNQVAGYSIDTIEHTARVHHLLYIERHQCAQPLGKHSAHTGNTPQTIRHGRVKGTFLLKAQFGKTAVEVGCRGF